MAFGTVNVFGNLPKDESGIYFGICSTDGNVLEKKVSVNEGFILNEGVKLLVYFLYEATQSSEGTMSINVNNTGAIPVLYKNSSHVPYENTPRGTNWFIKANSVHGFVYTGSQWVKIGDFNSVISEYASLAGQLTSSLTLQLNGVTSSEFNGSSSKIFNVTPTNIGAASYETGSWTPKIKFKISSSGWSNVTPSGGVGRYVKIGKIVFIWMYLKNSEGGAWTSYNNDLLFLEGTPFPYQFYADGVFACRGQLTWRYEGNITDIKGTSVPKGIYTTSQVVYSKDDIFAFSAEIDQYISTISSNAKIMLSGWYVAAS